MWDYICKKSTTQESKREKNNDNGQRKNDRPVATIYANLKNSWATSNQGGPYQHSKLTSHCQLTQNRQTKALQIAILENLKSTISLLHQLTLLGCLWPLIIWKPKDRTFMRLQEIGKTNVHPKIGKRQKQF